LTFVELLVALSAACIVLLATAVMLFFGQKSMTQGWQQANLQRDAEYAMRKITRSIRHATLTQLDADGKGVTIYQDATWTRFWFVPAQNDLQYQLEGESEQTLLDGVVKNASFQLDPPANKTVTVNLELQNGNSKAALLSTAMMRNYAAGT
jgi:Tfp pilus assembly protein PilW